MPVWMYNYCKRKFLKLLNVCPLPLIWKPFAGQLVVQARPTRMVSKCCRKGDPPPGPEVGLLSNIRKRIVRGDTCWQSKRFYWERAPGWRAVGKGTQENCSAAWLTVLGFMVMGLVSRWSLANHSNSVFPGGVRIAQPRWMLARGFLGSRRTGSVSSQPFPNSSGWWRLISSVFLIRISCHKTTHANGYYGAWPGWVVSISLLPLTKVWPTASGLEL